MSCYDQLLMSALYGLRFLQEVTPSHSPPDLQGLNFHAQHIVGILQKPTSDGGHIPNGSHTDPYAIRP